MKMFIQPSAVYLHRDPVDFRKQIDGLAAIVELTMKESLSSGALFVFCSKQRNKLKLLYWDKTVFFCGTSALKKINSSGLKNMI
jgi:transposase